MKKYQDFTIKISVSGKNSFRIDASSPLGEASGTFELPFDEKDLKIFMLEVGRPRSVSRRGRVPDFMRPTVEFGHDLYKAVIRDEVRDLFVRSIQNANQQDSGLRIRLRLNDAPMLTHLPWEFLYDGRDFLALSDASPLVRYLDLPNPPRKLAVDLPLRILVTISAPTDLPALNVGLEKSKIDQALSKLIKDGLVQVQYTQSANLNTLQRTLRRAKGLGEPFHIWHYIGHGYFDPNEQTSMLALTNEQGLLQMVSGFELGTLFQNFHELRLALLNACEGARSSNEDPFAGVSSALVERDIPAVIAMQLEISDEAAIAFASEFYEALVDGMPLDTAVTNARRAIFFMPNYVEWATPVLYLRSPDSNIFDIRGAKVRPVTISIDQVPTGQEDQRLSELYVKALSDFYLDRWENAIANFQVIVDQRPDYEDAADKLAEARYQLGLKSLYERGLNSMQSEDWENAIQLLQQVVAKEPNYHDAGQLLATAQKEEQVSSLFAEAKLLSQGGQWQAVLTVISRLDQIGSDNPYLEELRTVAQENLAREEREKAIQNRYAQAVLEMQKSDFAAAEATLEQLLETEPDHADAQALLERTRQERAAEERTENLSGLYNSALHKINEGDYPAAQSILNQILSIQPDYKESDTLLAKVKENLSPKELQNTQPKQSSEKELEVQQLFRQANIASYRWEWDRALNLLQQVQAIQPDLDGLQPLLTHVYREIDRQEQRKRDDEARGRLIKDTSISLGWWAGIHILVWVLFSTVFSGEQVFLPLLGLVIFLFGQWFLMRAVLVQGVNQWVIFSGLGIFLGIILTGILGALFGASEGYAGILSGIGFATSGGLSGYWQSSVLPVDQPGRYRWARANAIFGVAFFIFFSFGFLFENSLAWFFFALLAGILHGAVTGRELNLILERR